MEGPISPSAVNRLPSPIKGLTEIHQKTYIYLRLRKTENEIARQLNLPQQEASEKIHTVRSVLISAGQLDLIENPEFVSLHAEGPDSQEMPIPSRELDVEKKLIIKEFITILRQSIESLPEHQSHLLRLRYKHHMSAKDILEFSRKMGFSLVEDKEVPELKEQDIFYALNKSLKEVLQQIKDRYGEEDRFTMENLKFIFEEIEI